MTHAKLIGWDNSAIARNYNTSLTDDLVAHFVGSAIDTSQKANAINLWRFAWDIDSCLTEFQ